MNYKEITTVLRERFDALNISQEQFIDNDMSEADRQEVQSLTGPWTRIEEGRSSDGDHDSYDVIFHFTDHDIYVQASGYYHSDNGVDWSYADLAEVRPVEITVTRYSHVT